MLKNEKSISIDIIIIWEFSFKINDKSLTGRKPPEDINVKAKFKESNVLIEKILRIIKIISVKKEYNKKILIACLNTSELLNEIKFVNVFLKFSSYISIKKIIEKRKYNPPIHWIDDLHKIKLWSICLIFSKILNPVEVNPEIDSKKEFKNVKL